MVFFAPVTAPFFIYKSRKEPGLILVMVFLTLFSAVAISELFLYTRYMDIHKYSDLPPITRQMVRLSETLRKSTIDLDVALIKLENLSKVESRIHEIEKTIDSIESLRSVMETNNTAIRNLVTYARNHSDYFKKKELNWVVNIQKFYNNRNVVLHYKSLERYLEDFEELLRYTYSNFFKYNRV